jgi:membrane-associated phospholipid phosphatase
MPTPLDGLGADLVDTFTGINLVWYGGAFLATGAMALGGVDHSIRVGVQRSLRSPAYADASFYAGYILPALAAPAVYLVGLASHDPVAAGAGSAALQALAVTLVATGILKIATGRSYPLNGGDPGAADRLEHPEYARQFRPFQDFSPLPSWPSGHTSATLSIAAALTAYYPDQVWIPFVGYPIATMIGFGMVVRDSHWASDVVGGALVGHAIGYSVGRAFRKRVRGAGSGEVSPVSIAPVIAPAFVGVTARGAW